MELLSSPGIPALGVYPQDVAVYSHANMYTWVFTAKLFRNNSSKKKTSNIYQLIRDIRFVCVHTYSHRLVNKKAWSACYDMMSLENIVSEHNQTRKVACVIPLIRKSQIGKALATVDWWLPGAGRQKELGGGTRGLGLSFCRVQCCLWL